MNESEDYDQFKPDLTKTIYERLEIFRQELIFWADTRFNSYFDQRSDQIGNTDTHRVFFYVQSQIAYIGGIEVGSFGIRKGMNLSVEIRKFFFEVFYKHFPDGCLPTSHVISDIP